MKYLDLGACGWSPSDWQMAYYPPDLPLDWRIMYYFNDFRVLSLTTTQWMVTDKQALRDDLPEQGLIYLCLEQEEHWDDELCASLLPFEHHLALCLTELQQQTLPEALQSFSRFVFAPYRQYAVPADNLSAWPQPFWFQCGVNLPQSMQLREWMEMMQSEIRGESVVAFFDCPYIVLDQMRTLQQLYGYSARFSL